MSGGTAGRRPVRALVLGGAGLRGGAWHVGALQALRDAGDDPAGYDLVQGTSAGALIATLLTSGLDLDVLARHLAGSPARDDPPIHLPYDLIAAAAHGTAAVRSLQHSFRSPSAARGGLLLHAVTGRATSPALSALAAVLPRGTHDPSLLAGVVTSALQTDVVSWPGPLRVLVTDARTGVRVALHRDHPLVAAASPDGSTPFTLPWAVAASSAVPYVFTPVEAAGGVWFDGAFGSADSADLACALPDGRTVDEVTLLAPLTALPPRTPSSLAGQLQRRARLRLRSRLQREVQALRAARVRVRILQPDASCLELMGPDLMAGEPLAPVVAAARAQVRALLTPPSPPGVHASAA